MNILKIALALTFFIFFSTIILKSEDIKITDYNYGEKVQILDNTVDYNARIYFFITYPSCSSCIGNIKVLQKYIGSKLKIEFATFVSGPRSSKVSEIATQNHWEGEVIADLQNLYLKQYKMKVGNSYLILDNSGKLLQAGDIADESFNCDSLVKFLSSPTFTINQNYSTLEPYKSITVTRDSLPLVLSGFTEGVYSKKYDKYFIYDMMNNTYLVVSSTGRILKEQNIPKTFKINVLNYETLSWEKDEEVVLIQTAVTNDYVNYKETFFEFNFSNNSFSEVNLPFYSSIPSCSGSVFGNLISDGYISFTNFNLQKDSLKISEIKPLTFFNKLGEEIIYGGKMSGVYSQFMINDMYREFASFGNKDIYTLQNFSHSLFKYSSNGKLIDTIPLKFASSKKVIKASQPTEINKKSVVGFLESNSFYFNLKTDKVNEQHLVHYENKQIPEEAIDMNSPLIKKFNFINIFNKSGDLISDDIELKLTCPSVMSFNDNKIVICHTSNDQLQIQWYNFIPKKINN